MNTLIRKAVPEDAWAMVAIKNQLPLNFADGSVSAGGFLLGTDAATYRNYIEEAYCLVAEADGAVVGFGIVFPDALLRTSDVWQKRYEVDWLIDLAVYEPHPLCYFEQLAFLKGHKRAVLVLAYNLVKWLFDLGYAALFTTTVNKPILNLAAVPFIEAVAGKKVGNIDEVYPVVGQINSDIYLIEAAHFYQETEAHSLYPFFKANSIAL
ncbi:MAG: hypothetical protein U0X91_26330 [Spirosomataceae bacterium]